MIFKNLLLEKKYSLFEIIYLLVSTAFVFILTSIVYIQNKQIEVLKEELLLLKDNYNQIVTLLKEREQEVKEIRDILKKLTEDNVSNPSIMDSLVLSNQHEILLTSLKIAGGIFGIILIFYSLNQMTGLFSIKSLLPQKLYGLIQDYTPLFQEIKIINVKDEINNLEFIYKIINDKGIKAFVKEINGNTTQELSQFIKLLLQNMHTETVESNTLTITQAGENIIQQGITNTTNTIIETTDAFITNPAVNDFLVISEYALNTYQQYI
jgi:hypothetical protein